MSPRAAAMLVVAVVVVAVAACDRRAPITSCAEKLGGVWTTPAGARWMLVDSGDTLEGYPLFDDSVPDGAPRYLDLARGTKLAGELKRRFMRGPIACIARAPFTVTRCAADELQIVVGDVAPPVAYEPCSWPRSHPSQVEVWRRE